MSLPEVARLAYKEQGDMIRHFSTVRSALTTFLLTVALGAFSAWFRDESDFLIVAGLIFLAAAIAVCLIFSYRTEKTVLRYTHVWDQIRTGHNISGPLTIYRPPAQEIWARVFNDKLNYLLILVCIAIAAAFFWIKSQTVEEKLPTIEPPGPANINMAPPRIFTEPPPPPANTSAEQPAPETLQDLLGIKTTYQFQAKSLEFALAELAQQVNDQIKDSPAKLDVRIIGADLQLEGYTRNQTIRDFRAEDKTVAEILTALLLQATHEMDPHSPQQKLVWLIGNVPGDPAGKQAVLITTRAKAADHGQLPDIFVAR